MNSWEIKPDENMTGKIIYGCYGN